jgi:hydrogenase maturation protein HypF
VIRLHLEVAGAVQGVGFRPCVHRLAGELGLAGWVRNSTAGVEIEIEGAREIVESFWARLGKQLPPNASVASLVRREIPVQSAHGFRIELSASGEPGAAAAEILPDLATCHECLAEILDPADRRFGYPFSNCTHCGPRFSIVLDLPYDRANTTMRSFAMCDACQKEYESPPDRRFHAQPNACPDCGPQLQWLDQSGRPLAERENALEQAAAAIEDGKLVAVKGVGGFHLFADARNPLAIDQLRQRKRRPGKPFALMVPSLESAGAEAEVSNLDAEWLSSAAAPIVILRRRATCQLPETLAPGNPWLGIILPYSPLHHLLMKQLGFPVIATSGNRDERQSRR